MNWIYGRLAVACRLRGVRVYGFTRRPTSPENLEKIKLKISHYALQLHIKHRLSINPELSFSFNIGPMLFAEFNFYSINLAMKMLLNEFIE